MSNHIIERVEKRVKVWQNEILIEKQEKIQTSSTISCPQPICNDDILKHGRKRDWRGYKANSYGIREEVKKYRLNQKVEDHHVDECWDSEILRFLVKPYCIKANGFKDFQQVDYFIEIDHR